MTDLYHQNLSRIPKQDRANSGYLPRLITASKRPLSVSDLNWTNAVLSTEDDIETARDLIQSSFEGTIRRFYNHIIDVSNDKVCFSHRTFRDFRTPAFIDSSDAEPWYDFTELEANIQITRCCIWRVQSLKKLASDMPASPARPLLIGERTK